MFLSLLKHLINLFKVPEVVKSFPLLSSQINYIRWFLYSQKILLLNENHKELKNPFFIWIWRKENVKRKENFVNALNKGLLFSSILGQLTFLVSFLHSFPWSEKNPKVQVNNIFVVQVSSVVVFCPKKILTSGHEKKVIQMAKRICQWLINGKVNDKHAPFFVV